jgi:hypothetical protein
MSTVSHSDIRGNTAIGLLGLTLLLLMLLLLMLLLRLLLCHALLLSESLLALNESEEVVGLLELWVIGADTLFLHLLVFLRPG